MKTLTQEEKAQIVTIIGLSFVKENNQIDVVLDQNSNLMTPYSYKDLAIIIIAKLNNLTKKAINKLREILKSNSPVADKLKIIDILQLDKYLRYASIN